MKTIDIAEATAPLAEYARFHRRQTLVVMRRGRPIAALMPISTPADVESFKVSSSPKFQARIARVPPRESAGDGPEHGAGSARSRAASLPARAAVGERVSRCRGR